MRSLYNTHSYKQNLQFYVRDAQKTKNNINLLQSNMDKLSIGVINVIPAEMLNQPQRSTLKF
mgnify:CR=1 FL=1